MPEPFRFTTPRPWATDEAATPEQLADYMKACTDEERVEIARTYDRVSQAAHDCILMNHAHLMEEVIWLRARCWRLTAAWRNARRRARAVREAHEWHGYTIGPDDLRERS